ncbi:MAG TPA: T9SS type A sorting domain-containing protein [Bacteroidia bacterium]|nr:T9SS type A sorting domain-containing protein [Bacteroidia bacterium]HNS13236.1 T9SS type A sorting domain-containing protein [Bacteroidia bacterium]
MKSIRIILIFFLFCCSTDLFSQAHLSITNLVGLPNSGQDTVYSVSPYDSIEVTIKNTGNLGFQGEADILIRGNLAVNDTLFTDSLSGTILAPGDSVIRYPNSYLFNSVNYVDGDNIVVVWPQARTGNIPYDSLVFHVYYVSFQSISEFENKPLTISPNPGIDYIKLGLAEIKQFEYVRIFDIQGRIHYESTVPGPTINIQNWNKGLYYIEVIGKNSRYSGSLIIQ